MRFMKGLELSEKFYYEYGEKMIKVGFADVEKSAEAFIRRGQMFFVYLTRLFEYRKSLCRPAERLINRCAIDIGRACTDVVFNTHFAD